MAGEFAAGGFLDGARVGEEDLVDAEVVVAFDRGPDGVGGVVGGGVFDDDDEVFGVCGGD
ncbi:MAG: hypothetical protein QOH03_4023 [Kribbellaceae bacterium]|nr:hypothetical protein [Kribbellaceae bacterium]